MEIKDLIITSIKQSDDGEGLVEGFAAIFGNVDHQGDRIHPGAFTQTLNNPPDGMPQLFGWQHNLDLPFGRTTSLAEVGRDELPPEILARAPDATGGLKFKARVALSSTTNQERLALMKDKVEVMKGSSIGFDTIKADFSVDRSEGAKEERIREIREVRLWEVSVVALGANSAAGVTSAKSAGSELKMFDGCDPTDGCYAHQYKLADPYLVDIWGDVELQTLEFLNRTPDHYPGGVKVKAVWIVPKPDPDWWRRDRDPAPLAWSKMVDGEPVMFVDIQTSYYPQDLLAVAHEWWHGQELAGCVSPGQVIAARDDGDTCNERAVEFGKWFRDWCRAPIVLPSDPDKAASRAYFQGDGRQTGWATIPPQWGDLLGRPAA